MEEVRHLRRDPFSGLKQRAMQVLGAWLTATLGLRVALWLVKPILPYVLGVAGIAVVAWLWRRWRRW